MKKSKLIKSLVALAVSLVAAIGCISLVACGGGDPEVNSVSLNKTTLSLQVEASETLLATTDPADVTVTWTSSKTDIATVDANGKVTAVAAGTTVIKATAGSQSATCNVTVTAKGSGPVTPGPSGDVTYPLTNTFSYDALLNEMTVDTTTNTKGGAWSKDVPDQGALKASHFAGVNKFITLAVEGNNSNVIRGKNAEGKNASTKCIEIKDGALTVTFDGPGTLAIGFCSTGGSNTSGMAVKDESGAVLTGTSSLTPMPADEYGNEGFYQVTGTAATTVTYSIPAAGTYTIWGAIYGLKDGATANLRATRIYSIVMTDNGPQA